MILTCIRNLYIRLIRNSYSKDFIYFSLGYFFCAVFSLVIIAFVNKKLEPAELGKFSYMKSLFELLATFFSLNIYTAYLRFNNKGNNVSVYNIIIRYIFVISVLLFVVFYILSKSFYSSLFVLVLFSNERTYFFRSLLKMKLLNVTRILSVIITLLAVLFIVYLLDKPLTSEIILFSYAIGYLSCLFLYKYRFEQTDKTLVSFSKIAKYCLPGALLLVVDWLLNLSAQFIIKEKFGYDELASFAISQRALLAVKLFTGLSLMFYPTLYFREIEKKNIVLINKYRQGMGALLLVLILLLWVGAKYIYNIMGASYYIDTISFFRILLIAEFLKVISSFYSIFLAYQLKTVFTLFIMASGAVLNIILLLLLLDQFGIVAACYSSVMSFVLILVLVLYFSYRRERIYIKQ